MITREQQELILAIIQLLNNSGVKYAVLRNSDGFPAISSRDLDIGISEPDLIRNLPHIFGLIEEKGFTVVKRTHRYRYYKFVVRKLSAPIPFFQIDFFCWEFMYGLPLIDEDLQGFEWKQNDVVQSYDAS